MSHDDDFIPDTTFIDESAKVLNISMRVYGTYSHEQLVQSRARIIKVLDLYAIRCRQVNEDTDTVLFYTLILFIVAILPPLRVLAFGGIFLMWGYLFWITLADYYRLDRLQAHYLHIRHALKKLGHNPGIHADELFAPYLGRKR